MSDAGNGGNYGARITALEAARKEIEDALLVTSQLEARQSRLIRDLAVGQDAQGREQEEQRRKFAEQGERIDKLVSAIGQLIARIPPENLRG